MFLQYNGHEDIPIFKWKTAKDWSNISHQLQGESPRVIMHHHDGMPGLSNEELRAFLNETRHSLQAKGCEGQKPQLIPSKRPKSGPVAETTSSSRAAW